MIFCWLGIHDWWYPFSSNVGQCVRCGKVRLCSGGGV